MQLYVFHALLIIFKILIDLEFHSRKHKYSFENAVVFFSLKTSYNFSKSNKNVKIKKIKHIPYYFKYHKIIMNIANNIKILPNTPKIKWIIPPRAVHPSVSKVATRPKNYFRVLTSALDKCFLIRQILRDISKILWITP